MFYLRTILVLLFASALFSFATSIDEVVSAIKVGDAPRISKYFDNMVEISINEKSHSYSKSQAEMVLRDFFSNKGVKTFKVVHRGNSHDSEYCVGSLTTESGDFRTTIFMKVRGDRKVINSLIFDDVSR
ncbi:MAG: DUF4783 domain-containing protein [Chitinophagaceae bacterium]